MTKISFFRVRCARRRTTGHFGRFVALTLLCVLGIPSEGHAELVDNGNGLILDTDLGVMWLQDLNYAATTGFDSDGLMSFQAAQEFIAAMNSGLIPNFGFTDWRLPTTLIPDPTCDTFPELAVGFNCSGSEMGHLYYVELGLVDHQSGTATSYLPFVNLQGVFWSSTEQTPGDSATVFALVGGNQFVASETLATNIAVVPVRDSMQLQLTDDTFVNGNRQSQKYGNRDNVFLHTWGPKHGLVRFDAGSIAGRAIPHAMLHLFLNDLSVSGSATVHAITSSWNEASVTWSLQPSAEAAATGILSLSTADIGTIVSVDVTSAVQRWADGTLFDAGFLIRTNSGIRAKFDTKEKLGGIPAMLEIVTTMRLTLEIEVTNLDTGAPVLPAETLPNGTLFQVQVNTNGIDCAGQLAVTALGEPEEPPSVIVQTVPFIIGPASGNDSIFADPLTAIGAGNDFKVSASCNGAEPGQFATDTFEFFVSP